MVSSRFLCSKPSPWGVYRLLTQCKSQSPGNGPTVPPDLQSLSSDAGLLADSPAHRHVSISGPLPLLSFPLLGCSLPLVLPPIWCCLPVGAPSQLSSGLYQLPPSWWAFPHHCCYITPFLSPRRQSLFLFTILLFSKTLSTFSEAMFFTYLFSFLSTTSIQM